MSPPVCDVSIHPQRVLPIQMLGGRVSQKAMPLGHFHVTRVTYFDHSMNTILTYLLK